MIRIILRSSLATLLLAVVLCGVYPMLVYGVGNVLFHEKVEGSLVRTADGKIVGSKLIGQNFMKPEYFHGRPSSAGTGYDAANSSGSNLGPTNPKFADALKNNVDAFLKENPNVKRGEIPVDAVSASGSGLDPHLSPEAALIQVSRVARARGISEETLNRFVDAHIEGPSLGVLGEPIFNVLIANMDLDQQFSK